MITLTLETEPIANQVSFTDEKLVVDLAAAALVFLWTGILV